MVSNTEVEMMHKNTVSLAALLVLAIVAAGVVPAAAQDAKAERYVFSAFAVNMGSGPRAGMVEIAIERLSSPAEREKLIAAFVEKGQDGLLNDLQKVKPRVGFIRLPQTLGYDLQYAYRFVNADGTSRLVIATDRKISFAEARNQPRTMDYPFTLIEMRLDKDGNGEGRMAVATKIQKSKDGKTIELENYGISPVALNEIKLRIDKK
jgi:hypothetical protein